MLNRDTSIRIVRARKLAAKSCAEEVELSEESEDRSKVVYPKAQSRPEDTAGMKQQRRTAWIFAIGILVAFLAVSSLLMR